MRQLSLDAAIARLKCVPTDGNAWLQYALAALPQTGAGTMLLLQSPIPIALHHARNGSWQCECQ